MTAIAVASKNNFIALIADCYVSDYETKLVDEENPVNKIKEYKYRDKHIFFAVIGQAELSINFNNFLNESFRLEKVINWKNDDDIINYINYCNNEFKRKNIIKIDAGKKEHIIKDDDVSYLFFVFPDKCFVREVIYNNSKSFILSEKIIAIIEFNCNKISIFLGRKKFDEVIDENFTNIESIFKYLSKKITNKEDIEHLLHYNFNNKFSLGMFYTREDGLSHSDFINGV